MKRFKILLTMLCCLTMLSCLAGCGGEGGSATLDKFLELIKSQEVAPQIVATQTLSSYDLVLSQKSTTYTLNQDGSVTANTNTQTLNSSPISGELYLTESKTETITKEQVTEVLPNLNKINVDSLGEGYELVALGSNASLSFAPKSTEEFLNLSSEEASRISELKVEIKVDSDTLSSVKMTYLLDGNKNVEIAISYNRSVVLPTQN